MSQYYRRVEGGSPTVPTSFVTDDGTAIPAANILNLLARDTTEDNANGIQTTSDPDNGNNLYVELTNRVQGITSTIGAVTADVITLDLGATPGTFTFEVTVSGFDSATPAGCGYRMFFAFRTDGVSATLIQDTDRISHEEAAVTAANAIAVASGNNAIVRVTGVAALTLNWSADGEYTLAT